MATSASKVSKATPAPKVSKAMPAPKTADKTADSSSKPVPKTAVLKPRSAGASKTALSKSMSVLKSQASTVVSPAVAESIDNLKASLKAWAETHRKSTDAEDSESELTPLDNAPEGSEADEDDDIGDVDGGENELDAEEEEEQEGDEEEREVPVQQRKKVQAIVIEDDDDEIEVVEPVVRKKRRVENIDAEEDEVEDDEEVVDEEEEVQAHPKKKRRVMNLLGSDGEEEAEVKKMVSVKCKFQNQGAVFRCNVEGTLAEGNKAKVFLADVLAAAKVHPATTHFRRKVHSVSWFCQEEYIFDESVLVDIALDPHSPDYFDVAYTDSGRMPFCLNIFLSIFGI
ncbi:hypothetical protein BDR26DRAFT_673473 [Obelidium mucronatum]|nr:hypothetical protein BDR26DRAFT_673473 [Obelidium mucronatum]